MKIALDTEITLRNEVYQQVREKFMLHLTSEGATFFNPQRVDLLRKPPDPT